MLSWEKKLKPESRVCKDGTGSLRREGKTPQPHLYYLIKKCSWRVIQPVTRTNLDPFKSSPGMNWCLGNRQHGLQNPGVMTVLQDFTPQTRGDARQGPADAPAPTSLCKKGFSHSDWALCELDASWAFVTLRVCSHKMPGASVPEQVSCLLFCHHSFAFTPLTEIAVLAESRVDLCLVPGNKGKALKGKECLNKFETCRRLKYRIKFRSLLLLHSLTSEFLLFYSGSKSPTSLWSLSACWHRLRFSKDCKEGWVSVRFGQLILAQYLDNVSTQNKFLLFFLISSYFILFWVFLSS